MLVQLKILPKIEKINKSKVTNAEADSFAELVNQ